MIKRFIIYSLVFAALAIVALSCEDRSYYKGSDARVYFSVDTVSFDTIFTTIGSATLNFRVYNRYDQPINIENISMVGGDASNFRMNVDGYQGTSLDDITVYAHDSIYVFVEVTVDPNDQNLPLLVKDSISFTLNNNTEYVKLLAYGQDAHHFIAKGDSDYISLGNTFLTADKPYLIHDHLLVEEDAFLIIEEGTQLYFMDNKSLYVQGSIRSFGTQENPVVFRGARMDAIYDGLDYDKIPGQWGHVHLLAGSKYNTFNYTNIKNAIVGLQVDSVVTDNEPTVELNNCRIENCFSVGLYALGGAVKAENSVFVNCGEVVVGLIIGGRYEFTHCTIGNYYDWSGGTGDPALYVNNFYVDTYGRVIGRPLYQADFKNCIIYGSNREEIYVTNEVDGAIVNVGFNYSFDHCLIKTDELVDTVADANFTNIIWNKDPEFKDPYASETANFELDTLSAAKDKGLRDYALELRYDIVGTDRLADDAPDLGAYEYLYKPEEE